jgi:hypothetical protein
MTTQLREAIEQLCELPVEEQDLAAEMLFAYLASDEREYQRRAPSRLVKCKSLIRNPGQPSLPRRPCGR